MNNNFQRVNSISNAHAGKDFEDIVRDIFNNMGTIVEEGVVVDIGHSLKKTS